MRTIHVIEQCNRGIDTDLTPLLNGNESYIRKMPGQEDSDSYCYYIEKNEVGYSINTSYYVGIDWVTDNLAVQVRPKVEGESDYINYLSMLTEALKEPENTAHLDGLLTIDFDSKPIPLEEKDDLLSPFIVAQFLMTLKKAVRKGLKQSYYLVEENLNSKIKGKILVGKNISKNLSRGNLVNTYCQYQEYGVDSYENKLLKKALKLSSHIISTYKGGLDVSFLKKTIAHIFPYFRNVSDDCDLSKVNSFQNNPIYKDYFNALRYGILIVKRIAYGFNQDSKRIDSTPAYWIDMSKLFELYVFKELRRLYPSKGEITYHPHYYYRELDYLLNPQDGQPMVIDAKYKPRYHYSNPDIEDIRQISAYARMDGVYRSLGIDNDKLIDCLIIYANQECEEKLEARFSDIELKKVDGYSKFYKIGIKLPVRE